MTVVYPWKGVWLHLRIRRAHRCRVGSEIVKWLGLLGGAPAPPWIVAVWSSAWSGACRCGSRGPCNAVSPSWRYDVFHGRETSFRKWWIAQCNGASFCTFAITTSTSLRLHDDCPGGLDCTYLYTVIHATLGYLAIQAAALYLCGSLAWSLCWITMPCSCMSLPAIPRATCLEGATIGDLANICKHAALMQS